MWTSRTANRGFQRIPNARELKRVIIPSRLDVDYRVTTTIRRHSRFNFNDYSNGLVLLLLTALLVVLMGLLASPAATVFLFGESQPQLLTDPFLQLPTADSVRVVWFTEFAGTQHRVEYGDNLQHQAIAQTTKLSRMREDQKSRVGAQVEDGQVYQRPVARNIWRHEAIVSGLTAGVRVPYRVVSQRDDGRWVKSDRFTLTALPPAGQPLKILLTSDHQQMPLTATNLQKVVETVGQVDAVFLAGDLVNIPDRASEWFDENQGGAFFPSLQGRANRTIERQGTTTTYRGGAIIQSAPLFPATGNHEVMGRFSLETGLNEQYNDPYPLAEAARIYLKQANRINPTNDPNVRAAWLKDHSFNTDSFEEIFSLPSESPGGEKYFALTFGDVRLISLYATNIWRVPSLNPDARGKYRERDEDLTNSENWGFGQHIFEPISKGSPQYNWLQAELASPAFRQAKYRVVMFHHPAHSLGDNIVPAYTDPVQFIDRDEQNQIQSVRYEYPLQNDYLMRDVLPLLEQAGVQLVFYGHDHVWNRFIGPGNVNYLESSNVGNTYNAFLGKKRRAVPIGFREKYPATGDPNGLLPIFPNLRPFLDEAGRPLPYLASNDITAFSILDTGTGTVSSYAFDARQPNSAVFKFDEFPLIVPKAEG